MQKTNTLSAIFLSLIIIVIGNYVIFAQTALTGDWKAEYRSDKTNDQDKLQLSFSFKSERGKNQMGSSYSLDQFQDLSLGQITSSANSNVRFSLVREAGTVVCEGVFQNGKGSGTFRFTGNPEFVSAMKSRGFDFEKDSKYKDNSLENRLFSAATLNITTKLADDLLSSDFGNLEVHDLFKAAIFKIDGKFAREMKETGFPNLTFDDLVKARIFKIDSEFVREISQMGFENEPFESLVKMRIFKISPDFISQIRAEGLNNLTIENLVKMRIFNIDGEFIRQAKADGVPLEVEKLVQKRIGVWRKD